MLHSLVQNDGSHCSDQPLTLLLFLYVAHCPLGKQCRKLLQFHKQGNSTTNVSANDLISGGAPVQIARVANSLRECSPTFVALVFPVGYYLCVPSVRAAAKVRTTQRLNSTELTRNLNRYHDLTEHQGDSFSILRWVGGRVVTIYLSG